MALYALTQKQVATPKVSEDWQAASFCALLPDLTTETDAVTQRIAVGTDWSWAVGGHCTSDSVKNMARTQFYIHGLTGKSTQSVRIAARNLFDHFWRDAQALQGAGRYTNLCAAGFALHLYGDSFAHAQNKIFPTRQYGTGLGHGIMSTQPDLMAADASIHEVGDRFTDWLSQVGTEPPFEFDPSTASAKASVVDNSAKVADTSDETAMTENLRKTIAQTFPYYRNMDIDALKRTSGVFLPSVVVSCDDQIGKAAGFLPTGFNAKCVDVWRLYAYAAREEFAKQRSNPSGAIAPTTMDGKNDGPQADCDLPKNPLDLKLGELK